MNCELELIEKYIKIEYPYIVGVKNIKEHEMSNHSMSGFTSLGRPTYIIDICITESFFNQLENNKLLKSNIVSSLCEELGKIVKSVCPEMDVTSDNLLITFHHN